MTWAEAESTCNTFQGHLVSIHSLEESIFVGSLIQEEYKAISQGHPIYIGEYIISLFAVYIGKKAQ